MRKLLKSIYESTFRKIYPATDTIIENLLREEIKQNYRVLDLGCGPHSQLSIFKKNPELNLHLVGVDAFSPYIEKNVKIEKIHNEYLEMNILDIDFPEGSFDCAIMIDVIEHIKKEDFISFLPKLEKIAEKIIIITPNGFIEQDTYDSNTYQKHLSGWTVDEFESMGFKCHGLSGLKSLRKEMWVPKIKPEIIGNMICDMSQPFVYNNPKSAYHIIAIKK